MGEVYRADDLRLGQAVALKFLPVLRGSNPTDLARFHNEVRLARQVSHPNVCRVFDIGDADGVPFLTMEFVDGEDLVSLLMRIGRLPQDKALQVAHSYRLYQHPRSTRFVISRLLGGFSPKPSACSASWMMREAESRELSCAKPGQTRINRLPGVVMRTEWPFWQAVARRPSTKRRLWTNSSGPIRRRSNSLCTVRPSGNRNSSKMAAQLGRASLASAR
jgi:hypothetical protein